MSWSLPAGRMRLIGPLCCSPVPTNMKVLTIRKDLSSVCLSACSRGVVHMIRMELITLYYVLSSPWFYHKLLATRFHWAVAISVIRTIWRPKCLSSFNSSGNPAAFPTRSWSLLQKISSRVFSILYQWRVFTLWKCYWIFGDVSKLEADALEGDSQGLSGRNSDCSWGRSQPL